MTDIISSDWTELDASNSNPSPNGVQGGYSPSQVAPIIRAIRGAIKRDFVQSNAIYTSTGTATAYVLTYGAAPAAYAKGVVIRFYAHITNTGAATLNINGLGAKSLFSWHGVALTAGQIKAGSIIEVAYNGTNFVVISNEVQNAKFTGNTSFGDIAANNAVFGAVTANTASFTAVTANSVTLSGQLNVPAALGISFANNDGITFDDSSNVFTFTADGSEASAKLAAGNMKLTSTGLALQIDTPAGDTASDPYIAFYKNAVRQGYIQHQDGTTDASGWRMLNDATGDILILNNQAGQNSLRYYNGTSLTSNIVWHSGNDGSGSTLDADLLDGRDSTSFYRDNAAFNTSGNLTISNSGPVLSFIETNDASNWRLYLNGGVFSLQQDDLGDGTFEAPNALNFDRAGLRAEVWGQKIWHAGNDGAGSTLDADLLDGLHASSFQLASGYTAADVLTKLKTVDGSGSGLDADLLDGMHSTDFYRDNAAFATTGNMTITNAAPEIKLQDSTSGHYSARMRVDASNLYVDSSTDDVTFAEVFRFELDTKRGYAGGSQIITAAAGTAYDAARLGGVAASSYALSSDLSSYATVTALNLKANLASPAFTGSPTAPTQAAGNSSTRLATTAYVQTELNSYAGLYTGSTQDITTYPVGHTVMVQESYDNRNASVDIRLHVSNPYSYVIGGTGLDCAGTWRMRGVGSSSIALAQRTA